MGKKKEEKVVDLKPQKITDEQLKKVQETVNNINRGQLELGVMETRKHMLLHNVAAIQEHLTVMQNEFQEQFEEMIEFSPLVESFLLRILSLLILIHHFQV